MGNVAVLGYGTVGSGVVDVIERHSDLYFQKTGVHIRVKYIVDIRTFPEDPYGSLVTADYGLVENDPEIQTVVETIGGSKIAYDYTKRALAAGKNVVTSNKELVAKHGVELFALAKEHGVRYLFEASVGGGIPIIRPLSQCLAANKVTEIYGILNGTTNYILTRMKKDGVSFDAALKEAQALGYAEANPDADILGWDTCRKISILASLAFGSNIAPESVQTEGITKTEVTDMAVAEANGYGIKLLGRAKQTDDGKLSIGVAPYFVAEDHPLYGVNDVFNAIVVHGDSVDDAMFYGRGAGKYPTASAVVADVIDTFRQGGESRRIEWTVGDGACSVSADCNCRYYIRTTAPVAEAAQYGLRSLKVTDESGCFAYITAQLHDDELSDLLNTLSLKGIQTANTMRIFA